MKDLLITFTLKTSKHTDIAAEEIGTCFIWPAATLTLLRHFSFSITAYVRMDSKPAPDLKEQVSVLTSVWAWGRQRETEPFEILLSPSPIPVLCKASGNIQKRLSSPERLQHWLYIQISHFLTYWLSGCVTVLFHWHWWKRWDIMMIVNVLRM